MRSASPCCRTWRRLHQPPTRFRHPLGAGAHVAEQGIDRAEIKGYYTEEFTHLAVAAAIASGVADAGIGIEAAARRVKLDFIPLFVEDYYLLGKRETVERADVETIMALMMSVTFVTFSGTRSVVTGYLLNESSEVIRF
ncbi:MAG TPA: substrate-binding domain-containing protein [Xanthobacteraceae bacterium]|nr:substrate-binding domain-containing protein [Xanthobacteraceae bacterium]